MSISSNAGHAEHACCDSCCDSPALARPILLRQVAWLQYVTIGWMLVECALSLLAAVQAHSVALLAFGSDSLIELLSAAVVLLQFLPRFPLGRTKAERLAAMLLFLLAGAVVIIAVLSWRTPMETSRLGIGITAAALLAMPALAWLKRKQARKTNDRALAADAVQSATCAYLAAVTLAGLVIFAFWRVAWVDSLAALAAVPVLIVEGRRAWRGEGCGCAH
jgi:divalent metal cation (Fe/Co/Zn/Cd) transporter